MHTSLHRHTATHSLQLVSVGCAARPCLRSRRSLIKRQFVEYGSMELNPSYSKCTWHSFSKGFCIHLQVHVFIPCGK